MIKTENLSRHYQLGEQVTALEGVSVDRCRRVRCDYRSIGSGKSTFME